MASSSISSSRKSSVKVGKLPPALQTALGRQTRVLPRKFFGRPTNEVARDLLGRIFALKTPEGVTAARIVETEAYRADDPASHSCRGETPRAAVMFGNPGVAYVYFIYGTYEMLNFVTEPRGQAGAVLIRAVEPLLGLELMARRRRDPGMAKGLPHLTAGPGRLCRAMAVELHHNSESLQGPELWVLDDGFRPESISVSPRVGIRLATEKPWRYFITGNRFVSRAPQNQAAVLFEPVDPR